MKALPDPTLRYVAPAITVNIPANTQLGHSSPALRLKVTPHVLLPSPPFSPAIRSLKAVETHVQTVVPLGSLIECSIRLEGCADDIDEGATAASPALHIVVKTFISALSKVCIDGGREMWHIHKNAVRYADCPRLSTCRAPRPATQPYCHRIR